jgi:GMP synthase-like glutamine amidotransferase
MSSSSLRIAVVNNYRRRRYKGYRLARTIATISNSAPEVVDHGEASLSTVTDADAVVMSGGDGILSVPETAERYAGVLRLLHEFPGPILGICLGHQLLGVAFGSRVVRLPSRRTGFNPIRILDHDPLFMGLPPEIWVRESHQEIIDQLMPEFHLLAQADGYEVEAVRHAHRPVYGVQFHPERFTDEHPAGRRVLENFLALA